MAWYNIPMVFNLVFHIIWFSVKGIQALIRRFGPQPIPEPIPVQPGGGDGPVPAAVGASAAPATRRPPPPHRLTVHRLFLAFAPTFVAIHHLVDRLLSPAPAPGDGLAAEAKASCVEEAGGDNFFCTDDPREARRRTRKTARYYLDNFGVAQTIEGNGEENERMRKVADGMEEYFKQWIVTYDHVESLKEKCINKHDKCVFWASIGECIKNPGYMENDCMLACQGCEKLLHTPESQK